MGIVIFLICIYAILQIGANRIADEQVNPEKYINKNEYYIDYKVGPIRIKRKLDCDK